jgi:hypothetical protein
MQPQLRTSPTPAVSSPHFLEGYPGALSPQQCRSIVERFNGDAHAFASRTQNRLSPLVRSGTMLNIVELPDWQDVLQLVERTIRRYLPIYAAKYPAFQHLARPENHIVSPALLERIEPGQGYGYHIDAGPWGTHDRLLATLIYLADVAEGGHTEFPYQSVRVQPRQGLLVMFPPFWTHLHRGAPPISNTKFNITNFVMVRPTVAVAA